MKRQGYVLAWTVVLCQFCGVKSATSSLWIRIAGRKNWWMSLMTLLNRKI